MNPGLNPSAVDVLDDDRSENGDVEELSGVVGSDLELLGDAFTALCDPGETADAISDTDDRDASE